MPRFAPTTVVGLCIITLCVVSQADQTTLLDDLTFPGRWRADEWVKAPGTARSVEDAPDEVAGEGSLRIDISWPFDDEFRFFSVKPTSSRGAVPYRIKAVSLWVNASADPHALEVHFKDANDGDVKIGFGALTFDGWQQLNRSIPADWEQPLTLSSITWHSWGLKGAGGPQTTHVARLECAIDETDRLVAGDELPDLLTGPGAPHGMADADGRGSVSVRLLAWRQGARRLTVHDEVTDADGNTLAADESEVDFTGEASLTLPHELPRNGCYTSLVTVSQGGDEPFARVETPLVRLAPQPGAMTDEERARSSIGVNTHLGAPWAAFEGMGIHWARDYSWTWLGRGETAPVGQGRDYAVLHADAMGHHVNLLPVMQGAFRNEAETGFLEDSAAISAGFEALTKALPQIAYWEIDNEYEYHLRDKGFNVADYRRALVAASQGLTRGGTAQLVPTGTAGIQYDLAEQLLNSEARDAIAVINSHFYTGTAPPELGVSDVNMGGDRRRTPLTALDQLRRISKPAHKAGKQSWLTEIGWDVSNGPAVGEENQALYLPRVYLLSRWVGADKVFWFYDRDIPGGTGIFSTCGLIRVDGSIRPSGVAMAALSQQTARAQIVGSLDLGDKDIWALVLRQPEGDWTVAVWSVLEEHPLPDELSGREAVDIFGNPAKPKRITPAIAYYSLLELPQAWDAQRQVTWESSSVLLTSPAGSTEAVVSAREARIAWADLPDGVTAAGWEARDGRYTDVLAIAPTVAEGEYPLVASAEGQGWQRTWEVRLRVEPPLKVTTPAGYEAGQAEICTVASPRLSGEVTAR